MFYLIWLYLSSNVLRNVIMLNVCLVWNVKSADAVRIYKSSKKFFSIVACQVYLEKVLKIIFLEKFCKKVHKHTS